MKPADTMVMDKPELATRPSDPAAGTIKSILFVVHDDEHLEARLQSALSLSRACSAHIQLLHVIPTEAYAVVDTYGGAFVSGEIVDALLEGAEKIRAQLEAQLKREDVSWDYEVTTSIIVPEILQHAAFADVVFIGREPSFHEFSRTGPGLLGDLVCSARTPLCIPGDGKTTFDPFGKAAIGWNGSVESANAIRATVGLLKMASEVRIVRFTENKDLSLSDQRILEYLSRHGVHAELDTHLPKSSIAEGLVDYAAETGADYLVMGGYSHSRAGEFLFGGVTRQLLKGCPTTLVMGH